MISSREAGSFRDPSGFVFTIGDCIYRQVQTSYSSEYDLLMASGLYTALTTAGLLIEHTEDSLDLAESQGAYRILRAERIPFISYPYEWCFSQLKDAALATLEVQKLAVSHGMSLKDATAYNIQFRNGKPVFIDTLSFERYTEGRPWVAYRQFCQHFVAPLALMTHTDIRLGQLLRTNLDGVPLDLAARLLPKSTCLKPGLLTHVHIHGAAQRHYADQSAQQSAKQGTLSKMALLGLIDSLEGTIRKLNWLPGGTTWSDYYANTNYSDSAMEGKKALVSQMLALVQPSAEFVWDLGANTGLFSRLASSVGAHTIAWDIDPAAVEKNYLQCKSSGERNLLPLLSDLTNPSPSQGWALTERMSMVARGPAGAALALALVHHLAIANNVPLDRVAEFFCSLTEWLIVEFVPKSDSQVKRLLAAREDIFEDYHQDGFEQSFRIYFEIIRSEAVPQSERTLYLMRARKNERG